MRCRFVIAALGALVAAAGCAEERVGLYGACASSVDCASTACAVDAPGGGYCVEPASGTHGADCPDGACPKPLHCRALGVGTACVLPGAIPCDPGFTACGEGCVNLLDDPQHCGGCAQPCPTGGVCGAGECACPEGTAVCDGRCVDPARDPEHCGGCGLPCRPPNGLGVCDDGACRLLACDEGYASCEEDPSVGCTAEDAQLPTPRVTVSGPLWEPGNGMPPGVSWVGAGEVLTLSGIESGGPGGSAVDYTWSLVGSPTGALAPLSAGEGPQVNVHTTLVGTYEVDLHVEDEVGGQSCRSERVTIWAENREALRFELTWVGPADLDLHLMATPHAGGDWFHPDFTAWQGNPSIDWGAIGEEFDDPVPLALGDRDAPMEIWAVPVGLATGFRTSDTGIRIGVRRPADGLGGQAVVTFRYLANAGLPYPEDDVLFVWTASLAEDELWEVGRARFLEGVIPFTDPEGHAVVVPAPAPP